MRMRRAAKSSCDDNSVRELRRRSFRQRKTVFIRIVEKFEATQLSHIFFLLADRKVRHLKLISPPCRSNALPFVLGSSQASCSNVFMRFLEYLKLASI